MWFLGLTHGLGEKWLRKYRTTITYICIYYFCTISQKFQECHDPSLVSYFVQRVQITAITHRKISIWTYDWCFHSLILPWLPLVRDEDIFKKLSKTCVEKYFMLFKPLFSTLLTVIPPRKNKGKTLKVTQEKLRLLRNMVRGWASGVWRDLPDIVQSNLSLG